MIKEEFVDFLNSYRIMMEFDEENKWYQSKIYEDVLQLSNVSLAGYTHETPSLNINVRCNNSFAELHIVTGVDFRLDANMLIASIEDKDYKFRKFKHKSLDYYGGYEIFVKGDYEVIKDAFLFSVSKLKELL